MGAELIVLSQAADGSMANELYSIRGILGYVADATDRTGVFMLASSFRELMALPKGAHQLIVRRPDTVALPAAAEAISELAPTLDINSHFTEVPHPGEGQEGARNNGDGHLNHCFKEDQ